MNDEGVREEQATVLVTPQGTVRHRPSGYRDGRSLCGLEVRPAKYPEATVRAFRICRACERKSR